MFKKAVTNIKKLLARYLERIGKIILDNKQRDIFMFRVIIGALGMVSAVMSVVNVFTHFRYLMISTIAFACVSFGCLIFSTLGEKCYRVARMVMLIAILALFTFFIICGEPEGFSAFWTAMLPACGILMFGFRYGLVLDIVMLAISIFLCWTGPGNSLLQFEYTSSFLMRFPLLYMGFMSVGLLLSLILTHTQQAYHDLSNHDMLTGALNRNGFVEALAEYMESSDTIGFMILDLDLFKRVNDTYGHFIGDEVLCYAMKSIQECCPGCPVCRWGGEEFAVFINNGAMTRQIAQKIVSTLSGGYCVLRDGRKIHQTISCGAVEIERERFDQDKVAIEADKCLYEAKQTGRNKFVYNSLLTKV